MIVSSYSFIDASTGDYQEEEVFYQEEGEENFDHHPNQGKIILLQSAKLTMSKASPIYFMFMILFPSFTLQALLTFVLSKYFLIYVSLG